MIVCPSCECAILEDVPLQLGPYVIDPPVVLAPMAGITNVAFRQLCREHSHSSFATAGLTSLAPRAHGPTSLFVCEMITTRALVERNPKTMRMIAFAPDERPRSLQLYGVDPDTVRAAVRLVVTEGLADHIDMNFGCPVPKVTRKGGGAALPWRRRLFARIVHAAVAEASAAGVPVTIKMRTGIDADHLTYVDAGLAAQEAGVAAVALHARTAGQRYSGRADWDAIATLKQALDVPVLGNGDIWEAEDALRMMRETGCDGVVVGRGCLGRPWLFADLEAAWSGRGAGGSLTQVAGKQLPNLGEVARVMRRHAELLTAWFGSEVDGCTDFRKHVAWYLKGFPVGSELRRALAMISSLSELDDLLGKLDLTEPFPLSTVGQPRGRTNAPGKVHLPEGWLGSRDTDLVPDGAELDDSGG
jgi:nifR3 family TIM-barrel protein